MVDDRLVRVCSTYGEKINANKVLVGKSERRQPDVSPGDREVDEVKVALNTGQEGVNLINVAQDGDKLWAVCEHGNELGG